MYEMVRIKNSSILAKGIKEIIFDRKDSAKPGQFYMIWLPGVDEFPMSIARIEEEERGIMIKVVGNGTKELFSKNQGDKIWIRGPYGKGFDIKENALIVAGGIGIAPLLPLLSRIKNYSVIIGARNSEELIKINAKNITYATDDGSFGFHGNAVQLAKKLLDKNEFDIVYGCGPEIMLEKLFNLCEEYGVECELSLERYMKCGIGLCGSCEIDGYLVCRDGPVFSSDTLRKMPSFGKFRRDEYGRLIGF